MVSTEDLRAEKLFSVKGFVCVVTGGGAGIGLMTTQSLAANGARVHITGRRMEALEKAAETHSPAQSGVIIPTVGPCDVTKEEELKELVAKISKKEKYINLLMMKAGISGPKAEPESEKASVSEWSDTFNTNASAVHVTTVAFLPLLQAGEESHGDLSASVVVISSMSGIMRPVAYSPCVHAQGHFSYNAAKGATVHLSKLMSYEPGYFSSEMMTKRVMRIRKSSIPQEKIKGKGHVPAQRSGSDEEMAQGVIF
ncbi:hypothetical protein BGZ57DRAFT_940312 [Hyaloscypha finlandica]|nr:hypothetical protein BGZ57DRAFT_940312 [Hyaloscypha finlandica]